MKRRVFFVEAGKAFPVVVGALYLVRCGSDNGTNPSDVAAVVAVSTVVNGHTHTTTVPASDQLHPADAVFTSSTDAGHSHMVTLTAGQLGSIAAGGSVTVTSTTSASTGPHSHDFTFKGKK